MSNQRVGKKDRRPVTRKDDTSERVKALRPLVDRVGDAHCAPDTFDDPSRTPLASALGLTAEQAEEARALGYL